MFYLHACMCTESPCSPEEGAESPGTGVKGGCELTCACWEPNLGPLQEQQMLLTTESSL